jgi:hypothetical protein
MVKYIHYLKAGSWKDTNYSNHWDDFIPNIRMNGSDLNDRLPRFTIENNLNKPEFIEIDINWNHNWIDINTHQSMTEEHIAELIEMCLPNGIDYDYIDVKSAMNIANASF